MCCAKFMSLHGTGSPINIPPAQDEQHKGLVVFCHLAQPAIQLGHFHLICFYQTLPESIFFRSTQKNDRSSTSSSRSRFLNQRFQPQQLAKHGTASFDEGVMSASVDDSAYSSLNCCSSSKFLVIRSMSRLHL